MFGCVEESKDTVVVCVDDRCAAGRGQGGCGVGGSRGYFRGREVGGGVRKCGLGGNFAALRNGYKDGRW